MDGLTSLEKSLAKTESDADAALRAATAVVSSLKKFRVAAKTGNLRELRRAIEVAEEAISALRQQFSNAKEGWDFNEETYLSGRAFSLEILEAAEQMGVKIFEQDDRLYCYPFLIRILPNERAILIDKKRDRGLRPSIFVNHLRELQNKPVRFRSEAFLESLCSVYATAVKTRGKDRQGEAAVIPLVEIYGMLTPLPGHSKEYSRQEFGRDLYLLDQSGVTTTREGKRVSLHTARGNEPDSKVIPIVTRDGQMKRYYGISFTQER
ncbi:MAG: hypothetical protein HYW01_06095 [Deltaproteobacteria bacterium]|nr:hypothetical protein [Deltaproteobacteria bacterium]